MLARWTGVQLSAHPAARLDTWRTLRTAPLNLASRWSIRPSQFNSFSACQGGRARDAAHQATPRRRNRCAASTARSLDGERNADRVASACGCSSAEIAGLLLDPSRAVLGTVPRRVHLRGNGVQLAPSDHLCVAGELLVDEADDAPSRDRWVVDATVSAVEPRARG